MVCGLEKEKGKEMRKGAFSLEFSISWALHAQITLKLTFMSNFEVATTISMEIPVLHSQINVESLDNNYSTFVY